MTDIIKYDHVIFLQVDDYEEFCKILYPEYDGLSTGLATDHDAAVAFLAQWDYGEESMQESFYDKYEAIGLHDDEYETDDYLMSWHHGLSYAGLHRKTFVASERQLLSFVHGYVMSMLWANTFTEDESLESYDAYHDGIRLDESDTVYDDLKDDCIEFVRENYELLQRVAKAHFESEQDWSQHGHDFSLTRNHHGAGFWDRGYGDDGNSLTKASDPYGTRSLSVDSEGNVSIFE